MGVTTCCCTAMRVTRMRSWRWQAATWYAMTRQQNSTAPYTFRLPVAGERILYSCSGHRFARALFHRRRGASGKYVTYRLLASRVPGRTTQILADSAGRPSSQWNRRRCRSHLPNLRNATNATAPPLWRRRFEGRLFAHRARCAGSKKRKTLARLNATEHDTNG